jgi:hypothetical protein
LVEELSDVLGGHPSLQKDVALYRQNVTKGIVEAAVEVRSHFGMKTP